MIGLKRYFRAGLLVSVIGHLGALIVGLVLVSADPFHAPPPEAMVVEVVRPDRIERWARVAGRENVIFGNDCGFQSTAGNSEIPVTVAWAKLQALGEGARIASARLWH